MHFYTSFITAAGVVISGVSAATLNVTVGMDNQYIYDPLFLTGVQNGDNIGFRLYVPKHKILFIPVMAFLLVLF